MPQKSPTNVLVLYMYFVKSYLCFNFMNKEAAVIGEI